MNHQRVKVARPPEEERHPRTGGYLCNICGRHHPRAIVVNGARMRLMACDLCVKAMVAAILDEVLT